MLKSILVEQLDSKKAEEIAKAISELSKSRGGSKKLSLVLNNTTGDYVLAIDLAKSLQNSKVDLIIEASGNLDAAGTILAASGKQGERKASLDAVFTPFELNTKSAMGERLTPKNQSVLATLSYLMANRRKLKSFAPKAEKLSAFESKSFGIVDTVERFESKYKNKSSKRKSSRK